MLKELLKKYLEDDAKVTNFLNDMKASKIYTSSEENIDSRYTKLKGDYDALTTKEAEAQALINQLKEADKGNEGLQSKITEYEGKIATLEAQNTQLAIDSTLKVELLAKGAKASDIDYLMFKAKQGEELQLDKDGKIKGFDTLIERLQKTCESNFDSKSAKKVEVKDLPQDNEDKDTVTKEQFNKMNYQQRNELFNSNKELYDKLKGE